MDRRGAGCNGVLKIFHHEGYEADEGTKGHRTTPWPGVIRWDLFVSFEAFVLRHAYADVASAPGR